jgi:hypothetical protein
MKKNTITAGAYATMLQDLGFEINPLSRDPDLFIPSVNWLNEFGIHLSFSRPPYKPQSFDCDDYAIWSLHKANAANAATGNHLGHTFSYATMLLRQNINGIKSDGTFSGMHACNIVLCDDGHVHIFEPQTGQHCRYHIDLVEPCFALV